MNWRWMLAALAVVTPSCVRQTRVAQATSAATPTVWDRQVRNARDAGDGDYALKVLRERAAAESGNLAVRLELAQAYQQRGYSDLALDTCRLAAARFPDSGEAELALVQALRASNRRAEAIASLSAFAQGHPASKAENASWLGILRDESGQLAEAETSHRQAVEADPTRDSLHNNLGYNLLLQQKYQAAAAEFRVALELNPASSLARNNLGLALANLGERDEALAAWQAGSDAATAHSNLAAVLIDRAQYAEAKKELRVALGYNKTHPAALQNLALVARLEGRPVELAPNGDESRWQRFKKYMMDFLKGPAEPSK